MGGETSKQSCGPDHQPCGLINMGNTCYCGAILQALFAFVPFRKILVKYARARRDCIRQRKVTDSVHCANPTCMHCQEDGGIVCKSPAISDYRADEDFAAASWEVSSTGGEKNSEKLPPNSPTNTHNNKQMNNTDNEEKNNTKKNIAQNNIAKNIAQNNIPKNVPPNIDEKLSTCENEILSDVRSSNGIASEGSVCSEGETSGQNSKRTAASPKKKELAENAISSKNRDLLDSPSEQGARKVAQSARPAKEGEDNKHIMNNMNSEKKSSETLIHALSDLFLQMNLSRSGRVEPRAFVRTLKKQSSVFRSTAQHDSHEFYNFLINEIGPKSFPVDYLPPPKQTAGKLKSVLRRTSVNNSKTSSETSRLRNMFRSRSRKKSLKSASLKSTTSLQTTPKTGTTDNSGGADATPLPDGPSPKLGESPRSLRSFSRFFPQKKGGASPTIGEKKNTKENTNPFTENSEPSHNKTTISLDELFKGTLKYETRCTKCKNITRKFEQFIDISLDVDVKGTTVQNSLDRFLEPEHLHKANKYYCERCKSLQEAFRSANIVTLPKFLALHLKRFSAEDDDDISVGGATPQNNSPKNNPQTNPAKNSENNPQNNPEKNSENSPQTNPEKNSENNPEKSPENNPKNNTEKSRGKNSKKKREKNAEKSSASNEENRPNTNSESKVGKSVGESCEISCEDGGANSEKNLAEDMSRVVLKKEENSEELYLRRKMGGENELSEEERKTCATPPILKGVEHSPGNRSASFGMNSPRPRLTVKIVEDARRSGGDMEGENMEKKCDKNMENTSEKMENTSENMESTTENCEKNSDKNMEKRCENMESTSENMVQTSGRRTPVRNKISRLASSVAFSEQLKVGEQNFNLLAVIVHIGTSSPYHGHYVCYAKYRSAWVLFDDQKTKTVISSSLLPSLFGNNNDQPDSCAYILFFQAAHT